MPTTVDELTEVPRTLYSVSKDGDRWCALYGANLQDGIAGFGDTPSEAETDLVRALINALEVAEELKCEWCEEAEAEHHFCSACAPIVYVWTKHEIDRKARQTIAGGNK